MRIWIAFSVFLYLMIAGLNCLANPITFNGYLNDSSNLHLFGSDLGAARFGDDFEIANNVALYEISLAAGGTATFTSTGFAAGGIDPYFTLFAGSGQTASFLGSNYAIAFSTGGDFSLPFTLLAGDYTLAIGTFANMSFAENYASGSLADGFTALGGASFLGNSYYELTVDSVVAPVPEPATGTLLATALFGAAALRRKRNTRNLSNES